MKAKKPTRRISQRSAIQQTADPKLLQQKSRADIVPLRAHNGSIHWVVPAGAPDAEYEYAVCGAERGANGISGTNGSTTCSPSAALNQAQVWWHQCAYAWDPDAHYPGGTSNGQRCTAGVSVLRVFGYAIAFGTVAAAPSQLRRYRSSRSRTGRAPTRARRDTFGFYTRF